MALTRCASALRRFLNSASHLGHNPLDVSGMPPQERSVFADNERRWNPDDLIGPLNLSCRVVCDGEAEVVRFGEATNLLDVAFVDADANDVNATRPEFRL